MDGLIYLAALFWVGIFTWFFANAIDNEQNTFDQYVVEHKCVTASDETIWKCEVPNPHWILRKKQ